MNILCKLGKHHLDRNCRCTRCYGSFHQVQNCRCIRCHRDEHQYDHCKCTVCGNTLPIRSGSISWEKFHVWNGCTCKICGQNRDSDHIWKEVTPCSYVCEVCGKTKEACKWQYTDKCFWICPKCGRKRMNPDGRVHEWVSKDGGEPTGTCSDVCKHCGKQYDYNHTFDKESCGGVCTVCGKKYQWGPWELHTWVLDESKSCPDRKGCKRSFSECNWEACETYVCTVCGAVGTPGRYL